MENHNKHTLFTISLTTRAAHKPTVQPINVEMIFKLKEESLFRGSNPNSSNASSKIVKNMHHGKIMYLQSIKYANVSKFFGKTRHFLGIILTRRRQSAKYHKKSPERSV